jgi:hypothetical protein
MADAEVYRIKLPLTEAAAQKAIALKKEQDKKEIDIFTKEFKDFTIKGKSWYRLISKMNTSKTEQVAYFCNGYKITIEKA